MCLLTCPLTPLKVKGLQVLQPGWWEDGVPLLDPESGDREALGSLMHRCTGVGEEVCASLSEGESPPRGGQRTQTP